MGGKGAKINHTILNPSHFERLLSIWRWMLNEGRIHYWLPIGFVTVDHGLRKEVTHQHLNLFLVEVSLVYISSWDPIQRAGVVCAACTESAYWLNAMLEWSGYIWMWVVGVVSVQFIAASTESAFCSDCSLAGKKCFWRLWFICLINADITRWKVDLDRDIFYRRA